MSTPSSGSPSPARSLTAVSLLVDRGAGGGAAGSAADGLVTALRGQDLDVEVVQAGDAAESAEAARDIVSGPRRFLLVAGDDATVNAVVNAVFEVGERPEDVRGVRDDLVLGVAACGWYCDFVRTFGLDRPAPTLARKYARSATMPVDLGHVRYRDPQGRPATRLFANVAQVGWGAELVRRAVRLRKLGRVGRLLAAYGAIAATRRPQATVTLAHTTTTAAVVDVVVANGQFFNEGMKVAPRALPDDDRFNVQIYTGERSQLFTMTQRIYRGEHLPSPDISEYQSPTVGIAPAEPLPVEVDGQYVGTTPATFATVHRALELKI